MENASEWLQPPADLSVGDRLGRFEILGPIGAGGMGVVYRARDPQLLREVAIKVLPTAQWQDPSRQRRFEREARAAAGLNHPNVLAVHDFGVHDGIAFIVTELLEGETLRQRIGRHRLPPRGAVEYAIQIAEGMAAGHERGIVHRDIKPENLFVTKDGRIKILDFGLAKTVDPDSGDATATLTQEGAPSAPVLGTAPYMSPEQVRGQRTDHRSDIFSAGAVLYEMLAGFAPFRRTSNGESLYAVLHDDPPPLSAISSPLETIVRHCLEKEADQRFQNARDLMFDLKALPPAALTSRRMRWRALRWGAALAVVAAAMLAGAAIGWFTWSPRAVSERSIVHRMLRLTDFAGIEEFPAISPDGRSVAFTASVDGRRQIFVRLLAGGSPLQISNDPADHQLPRWSPDGNSLIYFSPGGPGDASGAIWSIPALGGSPRRVMDSVGGGDVGSNGRLASFRLAGGKVQLVTSGLDGADVRIVADSVPGYHLYPRWSPDGRWIAFQRGDGPRYDIYVIGSEGGETRQLTQDRNIIRGLTWLTDSSSIVYATSRASTVAYLPSLSLWSVPLAGGDPRQVTSADVWYEQPDIHSNGKVAVSRVRMLFDLWRFPFDEKPADAVEKGVQITRQTGQVLTPTASPDGEHVAYLSDSGGHTNLWVVSMRTGARRQLTFEDDPEVTIGAAVWSPDGRSIAFVSSKGRTGLDFGIWAVDPDGGNLRRVVNRGLGMTWSPDSRWIYFAETSAGVVSKVPASGGAPIRVRSEPGRNLIGLHGTTLYYTVERMLLDGRPELEIRAATPENGPSRAIARIAASRVPAWQIVNPSLSPDGEWLALPLTDGFTTNIWAVSTRTGTWRQVTDFGRRATFIARRVSWSADGRSILAAVGEGDADIVLLEGLLDGRKTPRLVPRSS